MTPSRPQGGVEQPAGTRSRRAVDSALEHLGDDAGTVDLPISVGNFAAASQGMKHRRAHPPGLPRRGIAAGLLESREMTEPLEAVAIDPQQFSAPGLVPGSETEPIQRNAENRSVEAVFGHDRGDMGMVVLDGDSLDPQSLREAAAVEIGGAGRGPQRPGSTPVALRSASTVRSKHSTASMVSRLPTSRETTALSPSATQIVFFRNAPTPSTPGTARGRTNSWAIRVSVAPVIGPDVSLARPLPRGDGGVAPPGQPVVPVGQAVAGRRGDLQHLDIRVHPLGKIDALLDIEVQVRQKVDLVENHQVGLVEHVRVFERLVLALGHREHDDLVGLAEVEGGPDRSGCRRSR